MFLFVLSELGIVLKFLNVIVVFWYCKILMDIIVSCGKCKKIVWSSVIVVIMVFKKLVLGKDIGVVIF